MTEAGRRIQEEMMSITRKFYAQALVDGVIMVRDILTESEEDLSKEEIIEVCDGFIKEYTEPEDDVIDTDIPEIPTLEESLKQSSKEQGMSDSAFDDLMAFMHDNNTGLPPVSESNTITTIPSPDELSDFGDEVDPTKPI